MFHHQLRISKHSEVGWVFFGLGGVFGFSGFFCFVWVLGGGGVVFLYIYPSFSLLLIAKLQFPPCIALHFLLFLSTVTSF